MNQQDVFLVRGRTSRRQLLGLSLQVFPKLPQKIATEYCMTLIKRKYCQNVTSRTLGSVCRFSWDDSLCSLFPATTTQLFSHSPSSRTLFSCFETVSTTNEFYNFWRSKFQQVSTHAFCSQDDVLTQKRNCGSPKNLRKSTESPSTLSSNTSSE